MMYFVALLPATVLTIGGYLVLYFANQSEGSMKAFGKYLSFWSFTLAGLVILGAIFLAASRGDRDRDRDIRVLRGMGPGMMYDQRLPPFGPGPGQPFTVPVPPPGGPVPAPREAVPAPEAAPAPVNP